MIHISRFIQDQVHEVLIMAAAGIAVMLFYEIISAIRRKSGCGKIMATILELLFWIFASFLTSAFLYACTFGKISIPAFCAFAVGALLWKKIFYGIIDAGEKECLSENPAGAENLRKATK